MRKPFESLCLESYPMMIRVIKIIIKLIIMMMMMAVNGDRVRWWRMMMIIAEI